MRGEFCISKELNVEFFKDNLKFSSIHGEVMSAGNIKISTFLIYLFREKEIK